MAGTTLNIYDNITGRAYTIEEQAPGSRVITDANLKNLVDLLKSQGLVSSAPGALSLNLNAGPQPWTPPS